MKKTWILALALIGLVGCKDKEAQANAEDITFLESAEQDAWQSLFDGSTFSGWHAYNGGAELNGWVIDEGAMHFDPNARTEKKSANIVSDQEFTDFELSIDWKIAQAGNSGIMWYVVEDAAYGEPYLTGPEIQVLDDAEHPDSFVGDGKHKAGALYDMIAPAVAAVKPFGEWNTCVIHIDHKENLGWVTLNGTETARFPVQGPEWDAMVAGSKFADWGGFGASATGRIALQDHGDKVWYKNIKIKKLNE